MGFFEPFGVLATVIGFAVLWWMIRQIIENMNLVKAAPTTKGR
jgi:hypothetical protein